MDITKIQEKVRLTQMILDSVQETLSEIEKMECARYGCPKEYSKTGVKNRITLARNELLKAYKEID